jgi:hypothetical protein
MTGAPELNEAAQPAPPGIVRSSDGLGAHSAHCCQCGVAVFRNENDDEVLCVKCGGRSVRVFFGARCRYCGKTRSRFVMRWRLHSCDRESADLERLIASLDYELKWYRRALQASNDQLELRVRPRP